MIFLLEFLLYSNGMNWLCLLDESEVLMGDVYCSDLWVNFV